MQKEKEEKDLDVIDLSLPQNKFSKEDFKSFWKLYKAKLKKTNKPLFNILDTVTWKIDEKFHIHLNFDSESMLLEFEKGKDDFVKEARQVLNNYAVMVVTEVTKEHKTVNHIKTRRDVYEEFVKRNPVIDLLTKELGLDIDNEPE